LIVNAVAGGGTVCKLQDAAATILPLKKFERKVQEKKDKEVESNKNALVTRAKLM
jgi:hypothetical protein